MCSNSNACDRYDNMRYYYRQLDPEFKEKNLHKWVVIDQCKVVCTVSPEDNRALDDVLQTVSSEAFFQQIGHERGQSPPGEVLPIDDEQQTLGRVHLLGDLCGSSPNKIRVEYHPHEGKVIDATTFQPRVYYSGNYASRRMLAWLLLQSTDMLQAGKGIPATFLLHTGCPDMKLHKVLLRKLRCDPDTLITVCGVPNILIRDHIEDSRKDGINFCGLQTLRMLGLRIDPVAVHSNTPLHFYSDTPMINTETDIQYK